jgi:UPF0755 protein
MIKNKNTIIAMSVLVISIVIFILSFYSYGMSNVSKDKTDINVTIESGSIWSVGSTLKENNLIHSRFWFYFYCRASKNTNLMAGDYTFNRTMDVREIVNILTGGKTLSGNISITFREGINIRTLASIISENTNNSEEDVFNLINDSDYIKELINEYWFLTDDILNTDIYYSLEGYLYPETYYFSGKDVSVKEIFKTMLDQMEIELEPYKEEINSSSLSIHEIITLSSLVELEAKNSDDRKGVAGVFYNRLEANMSLGSDVTTYYAAKIDDWSTSLTTEELTDCSNSYNTRCATNKGLPVGPIANVSIDSVEAVLNPDKTSYYYFVADCDGNTYFSKTDSGNISNKNKLINEGKWCG